jgi:NRPS condensation-like uncharacterized protein
MTFCVELDFDGRIHRELFEHACKIAQQRHPMLRAVIAGPSTQLRWELAKQYSSPVVWLTPDQVEQANRLHSLQVHSEPGLRVYVHVSQQSSQVFFHFHHAACDGMGARRFVVDLLTAYARLEGSTSFCPPWDELDYESLHVRYRGSFPASYEHVASSVWQKLRDAYHFHFSTPQPILGHTANGSGNNALSSICKEVFCAEETSCLIAASRRMGLRLNDVAIALLFRTLAEWNQQFDRRNGANRLRIMMPVDLRTARDARCPAMNRMSFSFFSQTVQEIGDSQFFDRIGQESRRIRQMQVGVDFLQGLALVQKVPALLSLLRYRRRCMATAVLTNLGDLTKRFRKRFPERDGSIVIGNLVLKHVFGTPPVRPRVHAGFGICVCSGQLCLSLHGLASVLGAPQELLNRYVESFRDWRKSC